MNKDLQNLTKYPEFYALKKELENFCDKMNSIDDIDLSDRSRVSLSEEVFGRKWASTKTREFLVELGLIEPTTTTKDRTYE